MAIQEQIDKMGVKSAPKSFQRLNPVPLDSTSTFDSVEAAYEYAKYSGVAYPGQLISVNQSVGMPKLFIITDNLHAPLYELDVSFTPYYPAESPPDYSTETPIERRRRLVEEANKHAPGSSEWVSNMAKAYELRTDKVLNIPSSFVFEDKLVDPLILAGTCGGGIELRGTPAADRLFDANTYIDSSNVDPRSGYDITICPGTLTHIKEQPFGLDDGIDATEYALKRWRNVFIAANNEQPFTIIESVSLHDEIVVYLYPCSTSASNVLKVTPFLFADSTSKISFQKVVICDGVEYIGTGAFMFASMKDIVLPSTLLSIDSAAFHSVEGLTSIEFNDGLKAIEYDAFYDCKNLTGTITIPESVTRIGSNAFKGTAITTLKIPEHLRTSQYYPWGLSEHKIEVYSIISEVQASLAYSASRPRINRVSAPSADISLRSDGTYEITKYRCGLAEPVVLPSEYNGCPITSIADFAFDGCSMTSITISKNITSVGKGVFANCNNLEEILVDPENTWFSVENNCLICQNILVAGCKNSTYPDGNFAIGDGAFYNCTKLQKFDLTHAPDIFNINRNAFYGCTNLEYVGVINALDIMDNAFAECTRLETVMIKNADIISSTAFTCGPDLRRRDIYISWTEDDEFASAPWGSLADRTTVHYSTDLTLTDGNYLYGTLDNGYADSVYAYSVLRYIGTDKNPVIPEEYNGLPIIRAEQEAFINTNIETIGISANCTTFDSSFEGCDNLVKITFPNDHSIYEFEMDAKQVLVTKDNRVLIQGCAGSVLDANYPEDDEIHYIENIASGAFSSRKVPSSIVIPGTVTNIEAHAFYEAEGLNYVSTSRSQEAVQVTIEGGAFYGCFDLKTVDLSMAKEIGKGVLMGCYNVESLTIPFVGDTNWHSTSPDERNDSQYLGWLYGLSSGSQHQSNCNRRDELYALKNLTIDTVVGSPCEIIDCSHLTSLETLTLRNVGYIEAAAFAGCTSLKTVTIKIPYTVTKLYNAFHDCPNLKYILWEDSKASFDAVADPYTFGTNMNNCAIVTPATVDEVPEGHVGGWYVAHFDSFTSGVDKDQFWNNTDINEVRLANTVKSIGARAFSNCSNLMKIVYDGTAEEWHAIPKGFDWCYGIGKYEVYDTNGNLLDSLS